MPLVSSQQAIYPKSVEQPTEKGFLGETLFLLMIILSILL
ncbi:hypothetical protein MICAF_1760023 [Microcystis aeruginosa PCC 9807]|uniref:Uncharacterized protein n=1 Tax=Microcystis aeruginosa PCC 9807 TaxID=1160283 RepID=I4H239_MICAE|nr:hypothetical protein MICAF_1760023 [Microcystis aeruginosa PCC 9807]